MKLHGSSKVQIALSRMSPANQNFQGLAYKGWADLEGIQEAFPGFRVALLVEIQR